MSPLFSGYPRPIIGAAPRQRQGGESGAMRNLTRREVLASAAAMSLASIFALSIDGADDRLVLRDGWVLRQDDLRDIA